MAGTSPYYSNVNFNVPQSAPSNLPPEVQAALEPLYVALQQMIYTFNNNCGVSSQNPADWTLFAGNPFTVLASNMGRMYVRASEAIQAGAMCSFHDVSGELQVRNANATDNTKPCQGFCNVSGGIAAGNVGEIIIGSGLCPISGLTRGQSFWLSTSNGQITAGRPSAGGNIEQYVGFALSDTILFFNAGGWIQR